MSCNVANIVACPNLQDDLNQQFNGLSGNVKEAVPLLEFLNSPTNTAGVLQRQIDTQDGHKRIVELRYDSRFTIDEVESDLTPVCSGGTTPGNTSQTYEIDSTVGSQKKWSVALADLEDMCESDQSYFSRQVMKAIDVVERDMNDKMWIAAATLLGKFPTTGTTTAIEVQTKASTSASAAYVPHAIQKVSYEFKEMEWNGPVALFGGSFDYSEYFESMAGFCCNTTIGIDIATLFATKSIVPFYDRLANTRLGTGKFLAVAPGALQPIYYNKYRGPKGIRVIDQDSEKAGIIVSPRTGIAFDYYAKYDCETWFFRVSVAHDLVGLPDDLFCADDRLTGVTWVNAFDIVNPTP